MNYTVTLSDHEQHILKYLAQKRQDENRSKNVPITAISDEPLINLDTIGIYAEYAFCKIFNLHFDLNYHVRSGSYDCLYKNWGIDIKCTELENGNLIATMKVNPDVHIYVLAILKQNVVLFVGWTFKTNFIKPENIQIKKAKSYFLSRNKLYPMEDLRNIF